MGKSSSGPAQLSARAQPDLDPLLFAMPSLGRPVQVGGESVEVLEASSAMLSAPAPSVLPVPVPPAKPATSASALAAAILASRKAEPAIGGRLTQAAPSSCPSMAPAAMAVPEGANVKLSVPKSINVKLSVPKVSSSPVPASYPTSGSAKEDDCLSRGICWPVSWVSAVDAADDDEASEDVLASQTSAATKAAADASDDASPTSLATCCTADVRLDEKVPTMPSDGLSTAAAAVLGDEDEWVQVGQGG
jgi:hypothetical protein